MALNNFERRKLRVRGKVIANNLGLRPRIVVFKSNKNIHAQLIDAEGKVVTSFSSVNLRKEDEKAKHKGIDKAALVGKRFAENCVKANVKEVVFDKGAYRYHGRIKALAESCRKAGLIF